MNFNDRRFSRLAVELRQALSQFIGLYADDRVLAGVIVGQTLKNLVADYPLFEFFKAPIQRGRDDIPKELLGAL